MFTVANFQHLMHMARPMTEQCFRHHVASGVYFSRWHEMGDKCHAM